MKKVAIILDTNIAHQREKDCKFDQFHIFEYDNTIGFIERHDLTDSVEVFIPEIVLSEITEHRKVKLRSALSKLENFKEQFLSTNICEISFLSEAKSFDSDKYIDQIKERKLKEQVNIIPVPADKAALFNDILKKSVKKYPPFQEGKSDQGFKDSIILASIVEYFKGKPEYDTIYLFSNDNGFSSVDCQKIGINMQILKDAGIQNLLITLFQLRFDLEKFLEEGSFVAKIKEVVGRKLLEKESFVNELESGGYKVLNFEIERYTINEISDNECEVVFSALFNIINREEEVKEHRVSVNVMFSRDTSSGLWNMTIPKEKNE